MSRSCVGEKKEILKQFEREDGARSQFRSYFSTSSSQHNPNKKLNPSQPASTTSCEVITTAGTFITPNVTTTFVSLPVSTLLDWATHIGGGNNEEGTAIATDPAGNIFAAGQSLSNPVLIFNAGNLTSTSNMSVNNATPPEAYLTKYTPAGISLWTAGISGVSSFQPINTRISLSADNNGNVYIAGLNGGTTTLFFNAGNNSVTPDFTLPAITGGAYGFLAKFNNNGTLIWATITAVGANVEDLTVDPAGNCYLAVYDNTTTVGFFSSGNTVTPSITLTAASVTFSTYLAKYNTTGIVQWVAHNGGNNVDNPVRVAVGVSGNIYLVGSYFDSTLDIFNAGNTGSTPNHTLPKFSSAFDTYLIKYNNNGIVQWATHVSSTDTTLAGGVSVDINDNPYITCLSDTATTVKFFNTNNLTTTANLTEPFAVTSGSFTEYIAMYTSLGTINWVARINCLAAGDFTNTLDGYPIVTDPTGDSYVTGKFTLANASVFSAGNLTSTPNFIIPNKGSVGSLDVYVVKFDSNGNANWYTQIAGPGQESSYDIKLDASGNIITTGSYSSNPVLITDIDGSTGVSGSTGMTGCTGMTAVTGPTSINLPNSSASTSFTDSYIVKYSYPELFLPAGTACGAIKIIAVVNSPDCLSIVGSNGTLIDGAPYIVTCQNNAIIKLVWTGTQWVVLSNNGFSV